MTELLALAREGGDGNLGRDASREQLYATLEGDAKSPCPLDEYRQRMERHVRVNFTRIRTQLPGCNGKCVSFGCPDIIVQRCWKGMKGDML